jgi:hypothetical protein
MVLSIFYFQHGQESMLLDLNEGTVQRLTSAKNHLLRPGVIGSIQVLSQAYLFVDIFQKNFHIPETVTVHLKK